MVPLLRKNNLLLPLLWAIPVFSGLYLVSLQSYLLFHSLVEIFSIIVAFSIFIIAWNTRRLHENHFFLFLGITYFFVGSLDLLHTLSYKGMMVFPNHDANLPTQMWISARYLESGSLLLAPLFFRKKLAVLPAIITYSVIIISLLVAIFHWHFFPDCFVEGSGLTQFKIRSEYLICLLLLLATGHLLCYRQSITPTTLQLLVTSLLFTILAELAFTFYISVYGLSNIVGHYCKLLSFYCIYRALVRSGLTDPTELLFRNLEEKSELYQSLYDDAPIAYFSVEVDGVIRKANHKAVELLGVERDDLLGRRLVEFYADGSEGKDKARIALEKITAGQETISEELQMKRIDGTTFWGNLTIKIQRDASGNVVEYRFMMIDISKRKQAEKSLRESNARLKLYLNGTDEGIWSWGIQSGEITFDEKSCQMLGYEPDEIKFDFAWWQESLHPESVPVFEKAFKEYQEGRTRYYELEYQIKNKAGAWRWIWARGIYSGFDEDNIPLKIIGTHRDITERRHTENELRRLNNRLTFLLTSTPAVIYTCEPAGNLNTTFISENVQEQLGYDAQEIIDNPEFWIKNIHPDDTPHLFTEFEKLKKQGQYRLEYRFKGKNGQYRWLLDEVKIILDEAGRPLEYIGYLLDITRRKQDLEKLRLFRQQIDLSNDIIVINDPVTGNYLDVNQAACINLQYSREELLQLNVKDVETALPDGISWLESVEALKRDGFQLREGKPRRKDGTTFSVELNIRYLSLEGKGYLVVVARDIEARKRAEQDLLRSMKELKEANSELKQFSYVITHDLKASIRTISNYTSFLQEDLGDSLSGNQKKYLERLRETTVGTGRMVDDLLFLASISHADIEIIPVDLGAFLKRLVGSMDIETDIQIDLVDDWPTIDSDASLLRQIFQNLIDNALKYNISSIKRVELVCLSSADKCVECCVRDNGIGIGAEYHAQIFRMFERLHPPKEYSGSGIGLALVKRAVERLGGTIRLESELGKGSTFYLSLPKISI